MKARTKSALLCASCCFCYGIAVGFIRITSGIYFIQFQYEFLAPASQVSLAVSLQVFTVMIGGPLYAMIYKRIGPKYAIILSAVILFIGFLTVSFAKSILMVQIIFGLLTGFGGGLAHLIGFAVIGETFAKHRALANNLVQGANNIVVLVSGPLIQTLIYAYSWRGATFIQSAIVLNVIPVAFIVGRFYDWKIKERNKNILLELDNMVDVIEDDNNQSEPKVTYKTTTFDWSLLQDKWFIMFCIVSLLLTVTHMMKMMFLVRYAQSVGLSDYSAVGYMSISQALELACTIASGLIASTASVFKHNGKEKNSCIAWILQHINMAHTVALLIFLQAVFHLTIIFMETNVGFIVYSMLLGAMHGSIGALPESIMVDLFGQSKAASALGIRTVGAGIAALSVPPFVGWVVDQVGNYRPCQYTSALSALVAGILLLLVHYNVSKRNLLRGNSSICL